MGALHHVKRVCSATPDQFRKTCSFPAWILALMNLLLRKIRLVKSHEVTTKLARAGNNHTSATATNRTPTQVMARGHDAVPMFQSNFVAVTAALSEALRTLGRIAAKACFRSRHLDTPCTHRFCYTFRLPKRRAASTISERSQTKYDSPALRFGNLLAHSEALS